MQQASVEVSAGSPAAALYRRRFPALEIASQTLDRGFDCTHLRLVLLAVIPGRFPGYRTLEVECGYRSLGSAASRPASTALLAEQCCSELREGIDTGEPMLCGRREEAPEQL